MATKAEARLGLLDTLACIASGARTETAEKLRSTLRLGGPFQGFGLGGASRADAALYMGALAHAEDFDDSDLIGSAHPSAVVLPAILAQATSETRLSRILTAYAAGLEAIAQVGGALGYGHYQRGWHATATLGPIGAAAASSALLGLNADAAARALSLATSQSAGLKRQFGTEAKPLHAAFAARTGLDAARMAGAGLSAALDVWDGAGGLIDLYGPSEAPGFAPDLVLHAPLVTGGIARKLYPCCAYAHRVIEAALQVEGPADAIVRGVIDMPAPFAAVAGKGIPQHSDEARFSSRWCVAAALVDGRVGPESFEHSALDRLDLRLMAERIEHRHRDVPGNIDDLSPDHPDILTIIDHHGRETVIEARHVPGGPQNPMRYAEIEDKAAHAFQRFGLTKAQSTAQIGSVLEGTEELPVKDWISHDLLNISV